MTQIKTPKLLLCYLCLSALYVTTVQAKKGSQVVKLLSNEAFIKPNDSLTYQNTINRSFTINSIAASVYLKVLKDDYKTSKNSQLRIADLPEINIHLQQQGQDIYPATTAFHRSDHPQWEWQVSKGNIWQNKQQPHELKIALPFALQERNANCTHNGYMLLSKGPNKADAWQGYFQMTAETCAYLQFNLAGRLTIKTENTDGEIDPNDEIAEVVYNAEDLIQDYPDLKLKRLLPKNTLTNSVSGLLIKGKHYRLNCENRKGIDPYCDQLVLPSYSTAKSIYAGLALMRLEKLYPKISQVAVSKVIPECNSKQWQAVSLGDLLNMRTGQYLSKKPHVDESSSRMLNFFLSTTHSEKLNLACNMFKHRAPAGKYFVYHSSDTYLAGVMMNELFKKFSNKSDLYKDLMLDDVWQDLKLSDLIATSKRTYDQEKQTFTGWGLSYYITDLLKIVDFIQQQIQQATALDKTLLYSAMQIGDDRINRDGGEPNMAYNFGFWGLEVGHSLGCNKPKWMPFMSGFGGISIIMYSPDVLYYSFADDHKYLWLNVVKELNKQFPVCGD